MKKTITLKGAIISLIILITEIGKTQEIIELYRGKVDTVCDKLIIRDISMVNGKMILTDTTKIKRVNIKTERKKQLGYIIREDGEEKIVRKSKRRYRSVNFIAFWGATDRFKSYVIILPEKKKKEKFYDIHKGDTVEICMFCEKNFSDVISIGYESRNLLILLDNRYEIPLYAVTVNKRFCYIKDLKDVGQIKK